MYQQWQYANCLCNRQLFLGKDHCTVAGVLHLIGVMQFKSGAKAVYVHRQSTNHYV